MGMNVYTLPALNIAELKYDKNLTIEDGKITYGDSTIVLEDENAQFEDYFKVIGGSEKILKYLAEKYDLLIGGDGCLHDAGYKAHLHASAGADGTDGSNDDLYVKLFTEYATKEMLYFKDAYDWSDEFSAKLELTL